MPSVYNRNFVADVDCTVQVTVSFEAQAGGSATDWGSGANYQIQIQQQTNPGGAFISNAASNLKPVSLTRMKYSEMLSWQVSAGNLIQCDLWGSGGAGKTITFWNVDMRVEVIKR